MQPDFLGRLNAFNAEFEGVVRHVQRTGATTRAEAEDAAQHAFVQAWEEVSKGRWTRIRHPQAWIRRVALNHYWNSHRREMPAEHVQDADAACPGHAELVDQAVDVVTALRRLDRLTGSVMALRLDGIETGDIAEHLGIVQQEVWNRIAKARRGLRGYLAPPPQRPAVAGVVTDSESLVAHGGDLRTMSPDDREEFRAAVTEWRERLRRCPAERFGVEGSTIVLGRVATLAERLIADRDERTALGLVRDASPLLRLLGRHRPYAVKVRRACAEALSELGQCQRAERILRELGEAERRMSGAVEPRTALLLHWALVGQGRFHEAEAGLSELLTRLTRSPESGALLLHAQCRNAWLLGRLDRVDESVDTYAHVISGRTGGLSDDHPDTLDARHSQGKALVAAGRGEQALLGLQDLPEIRARIQGDDHSDTLESHKYRSLAEVLVEPRDDRVLGAASHSLEEILYTQAQRHGPDHPMSRDTGQWRDWLRRVQEANRFGEPLPEL